MNRVSIFILAALCLLAALTLPVQPAWAQLKPGGVSQSPVEVEVNQMNDLAALMQRVEEYESKKEWRNLAFAWRRISLLRPYSTDALYQLARAYALDKNLPNSYDILVKLQKQGMRYDPDQSDDFKNIRDTSVYEYIAKNLQANARPFGKGTVAFTLKSDVELIESIGYDAKTNSFFFGSVRTGEILKSDANGNAKSWLKADPGESHWGVFSLLVDHARNRLWVGTAAQPMFNGYDATDFGRAAILELDLDSGKRLAVHTIPYDGVGHIPVAMTQAKDGTLYISDALIRGIYRLSKGKLEPFFGSDAFTSLRGIALSADEQLLYISDYELGVHVLSIAQLRAIPMTAGDQNMGGVEGLYLHNNELMMLQTGTYPTRLQRAVLQNDGVTVKVSVPLEANKPEFQEPTVGVVINSDLYYITNSQLLGYGVDGKPIAGIKPQRRVIYRTPLNQPLPAAPPTPASLKNRMRQLQEQREKAAAPANPDAAPKAPEVVEQPPGQ